MTKRSISTAVFLIGIISLFVAAVWLTAAQDLDEHVYLPVVEKPFPTPTFTPTPTPSPTATPDPTIREEFRGLWVTRFDWTTSTGADPAKIDEIVQNAASAGFNVLLFQVRGEADAYYQSNYEPWAQRLTGTLGQNPGWNPLSDMIQKAHAQGIQVHAYINIYPVWLGCTPPADGTSPRHLYYQLRDLGVTNGKPNHLQWDSNYNVLCGNYPNLGYMRASPASVAFDNHILNVATDLVTNYNIDGIHLDHIRYGVRNSSCDPISESSYGWPCSVNGNVAYANWQRAQVNGTVWKFYDLLFGDQGIADQEDFWLTAAVWPVYVDYWGWGATEGYHDYYQDSKAWIGGGYIDAISPMIYGGTTWDSGSTGRARWQTLTQNFQDSSNGRYILPGIGTDYDDFYDIEARIQMARQIGTAGHALFSYGGLYSHNYFDDLAAGPYAETAVVPDIPWR